VASSRCWRERSAARGSWRRAAVIGSSGGSSSTGARGAADGSAVGSNRGRADSRSVAAGVPSGVSAWRRRRRARWRVFSVVCLWGMVGVVIANPDPIGVIRGRSVLLAPGVPVLSAIRVQYREVVGGTQCGCTQAGGLFLTFEGGLVASVVFAAIMASILGLA